MISFLVVQSGVQLHYCRAADFLARRIPLRFNEDCHISSLGYDVLPAVVRVGPSCSWLNLIERWFAELTNKRIRRDSFLSVDDLEAAIQDFLAAWNDRPKPFVWTATVDSILAKLARCRQTLEQIQPGCTLSKTRKRKSS